MTIEVNDWEFPDSSAVASKRYLYKRHAQIGIKDLYLGREVSTGLKCLMFKAAREQLSDRQLPVTKGLEIRFDFSFVGSGEVGVLLKLMSDDFLEVFVALVNDLLRNLERASGEMEFIETFFTRLAVWRLLLDEEGAKGLGPERRRGLFGELYLLAEILLPTLGSTAVRYWSGPQGAPHDFEFGACALEIKTSAGKKTQTISIANERQLDDAGYEALYLCELSLAVRGSARPNLIDMVHKVETALDPLSRIEFHNKLLMCGYAPVHDDLYLGEGYHIEEINCYQVGEGFPRLIGADLKPGVGHVKYQVDVSACTEFKISVCQLTECLGEYK